MQQSPLQHESPQINNANSPTINTTSNTLTPQITSTCGTNSISTQQQSGPQSPSIIVGLAAWVPPAGAGVGAATSEITATPLINTKASTTIPQVTGTVDTFTTTSALPSPQYLNSSTTSAVPVVTISSLLTPDPRTEELLGALTIDQLSLIEKTVQRVKRKKTKESKRLNSSNEVTVSANPNVDNIDDVNSLNNPNVVNNNSSSKQNTQNMTTNPISISTAISPITFINKDHHHYQSIHENQQIRSQQQINIQQHQFYTPQQFQQPSQISFTDKSRQSLSPISPRKSDTPISNPTPNHALPATDPIIEECDGISWVVFTYSVKGNNKKYRIRIDIDKVSLDDIDELFRRDNCLYPRANCTEDKYKGNRWSYENECNSLGWKLAWLNQEEIGGRRGLLQRAVDSYRNRDPTLRSRRVVRNEKIMNGTLRKRVTRDGDGYDGINNGSGKRHKGIAKQLTLEIFEKGISTKIRIRVDVDTVDLMSIPEEFKKNNCAFSEANVPKNEYKGSKYEFETACNELGWKLAFLNPNKLDGKEQLLHKAIELYRSKYTTELKPKRGRYSHTLSAKFFENHPRGIIAGNLDVNSIASTTSVNNNEITLTTMTTEANFNVDTVSNGTSSPKELTDE